MNIIDLFKINTVNSYEYINIIHDLSINYYDILDNISKKILFSNNKNENKYFWEIITEKYLIDKNIEEIQLFVKSIYDIYIKCPNNEYSQDFKPLDHNTKKKIENNNIIKDDVTGFCYDDLTYIKIIISEENRSEKSSDVIFKASINILNRISNNQSLTKIEKVEETKHLATKIENLSFFKRNWRKGALLLGLLSLLNTNIVNNYIQLSYSQLHINSNITMNDYINAKSIHTTELHTLIENTRIFMEFYNCNENTLLILYTKNKSFFEKKSFLEFNDLIVYINWEMKFNYRITSHILYLDKDTNDDDLLNYYNFNKIEDTFEKFKIRFEFLNDLDNNPDRIEIEDFNILNLKDTKLYYEYYKNSIILENPNIKSSDDYKNYINVVHICGFDNYSQIAKKIYNKFFFNLKINLQIPDEIRKLQKSNLKTISILNIYYTNNNIKILENFPFIDSFDKFILYYNFYKYSDITDEDFNKLYVKFSINSEYIKDKILMNSITQKEILYEFILDNYAFIDKLGSGGFGTAYRAIDINTYETVIIKKINKSDYAYKEIINYEYLAKYQNIDEYFPKTLKYIKTNIDEIYIVMKDNSNFSSLDNNLQIIKQNKKLFYIVITNIFKAIEYLHDIGIYHIDLKPSNIIVNINTGDIKIIDFGSASTNINYEYGRLATYEYSDHSLNKQTINYNKKQDQYAVGEIILDILGAKFIILNEEYINKYLKEVSEITNTEIINIDRFFDVENNSEKSLNYQYKYGIEKYSIPYYGYTDYYVFDNYKTNDRFQE